MEKSSKKTMMPLSQDAVQQAVQFMKEKTQATDIGELKGNLPKELPDRFKRN